MWTTFLFVLLISIFDHGLANEENVEKSRIFGNFDPPIRSPRRFASGDTRTRRLHIKNQTGFDGKVERIQVTEGGEPSNDFAGEENREVTRVGRLVEAYGMPKDHVDDTGKIERVAPPILTRNQPPREFSSRLKRSIDPNLDFNKIEEAAKDDLEAQEAKVFRPLFVYRQQVAKRQNRDRKNHPRETYKPTYHYNGRSRVY